MTHNYDELRLSMACEKDDLEKVKSLIEKGVDINSKCDNLTPLMCASLNGNYRIVEYLIEKGVDINAKGDCSWTALMYASWNNRLEIVKFLIENGANLFK